jgi:8-oxo-dGTP pyrophosphatase MutT (NUDIX family)
MLRLALLAFVAVFTADTAAADTPNSAAHARTDIKAVGCFIPTPRGAVLGIGASFNDIRIPMGKRQDGETARETAIRETREETGLDVTVGALLKTFENERVLLFLCAPHVPITDYAALRPLDDTEIDRVIVLDPSTMLTYDGQEIANPWRFAHDRALLIELFEKYRPRE